MYHDDHFQFRRSNMFSDFGARPSCLLAVPASPYEDSEFEVLDEGPSWLFSAATSPYDDSEFEIHFNGHRRPDIADYFDGLGHERGDFFASLGVENERRGPPPARRSSVEANERRGPLPAWRSSVEANERRGPLPAQRSLIEAMGTLKINQQHVREDLQCPVCMEKFALGCEARETPCKHIYHAHCIMPWLEQHNTCPVCRHQIPTGSSSTSRR